MKHKAISRNNRTRIDDEKTSPVLSILLRAIAVLGASLVAGDGFDHQDTGLNQPRPYRQFKFSE